MTFSIIKAMKIQSAIISEMFTINDENCLKLSTQSKFEAKAGQFLQAFGEDSDELLPTLLYPCGTDDHSLLWCGAVPPSWMPGGKLHFKGPRGNSFHLPPLARRVALTCLDEVSINRLLPLADLGLQNGAEVTILSDYPLAGLNPEIELLGLEEMPSIVEWADYMALVMTPRKLAEFGRNLKTNLPAACEVMLNTPMVCDENSSCGVCSVLTAKGAKLACKDGPVFSLADLLHPEVGHA